jgi:hypothetical protein
MTRNSPSSSAAQGSAARPGLPRRRGSASRWQYRPGLPDGFLAKTGLDLTPYVTPTINDL